MPWYTGHASVPNPHYRCQTCGRDLWDRRRRLRNPHTCPPVFITTDGRVLCQRCFEKEVRDGSA